MIFDIGSINNGDARFNHENDIEYTGCTVTSSDLQNVPSVNEQDIILFSSYLMVISKEVKFHEHRTW